MGAGAPQLTTAAATHANTCKQLSITPNQTLIGLIDKPYEFHKIVNSINEVSNSPARMHTSHPVLPYPTALASMMQISNSCALSFWRGEIDSSSEVLSVLLFFLFCLHLISFLLGNATPAAGLSHRATVRINFRSVLTVFLPISGPALLKTP